MDQSFVHKELKIDGMTCTSCEMRIENKLKKLSGVIDVKVSYSNASVQITYEPNTIGIGKIIETIEKLDYKVKSNQANKSMIHSNEAKKNEKMPINQVIGIGIILWTFLRRVIKRLDALRPTASDADLCFRYR